MSSFLSSADRLIHAASSHLESNAMDSSSFELVGKVLEMQEKKDKATKIVSLISVLSSLFED